MSSKKGRFLKIIILIIIFYFIFISMKVDAIGVMLKVAYSPNLPPYQFKEDDKPKGIHVEVLNEIAKRNNFIIEYVEVNSSARGLELLDNGKVDLVMGVVRNDLYEMTDNISESSVCMLSNKKNAKFYKDNIENMYFTIAMEFDILNYSILKNLHYSSYLVVKSEIKALEALLSGKADLLIGIKDSILYQLREKNQENNYTIISDYMMPIEYSIAVKSGNEELRKEINKGLYDLRVSGNYEKIYKKWINEDKLILYDFFKKVAFVSLAVLILVLVIVRIAIILKKQVNEKTKELQLINKNLEFQINETKNQSEIRNCIIENSHSSILVFDEKFMITLCNQNANDFFDMEDLIGKNIFLLDLCKFILYKIKDNIFQNGYDLKNCEIKYNMKNEEKFFRYNIYQLHNADLCVRGIIFSIEDITEEVKIKNEINEKEKNNTLNKLIASIAHEIRNPLMSIKTFAELIPVKANNYNFQNQMAEFIPVEVDRVNNLVKNLIDYAKPRQNNKEMVLINEIIDSCTMLINPFLENKNIDLEVEVEEGAYIVIDKEQLKEVLINLLINSLDSIQEKLIMLNDDSINLQVKLKVWRASNYLFIEIYDDGLGMSDLQLEKCTEIFYTTKEKGTGIGLALTKQFVEDNEGKLLIESEENIFTKITLKFGGFNYGQDINN